MEFYLNQKSLPMIRKCSNCKHFNAAYQSCSLHRVTNAYDHEKNIYLIVGENLYCEKHQFKNEDKLKQDAVVVEFDSIKEAMEVINASKQAKEVKRNTYHNL